jgi:hypothetical protein
MRNEAHAFAYQPEIEPEMEELISAPPEVAKKQAAEIIQLDDFRSEKKKHGEHIINSEYNIQEKIFNFLKRENILIETNGYKILDLEKFSEFLSLLKERPRNITIAQGK